MRGRSARLGDGVAVYARRERADEYAALMRLAGGKWYQDMLGAAVQALFLPQRPPSSILELGVGTGNLASRILRRFPRARLCGLDASEAMLGKARRRLGRWRGRVELMRRRFGGGRWSDGLPRFDAAISTIAIHHLRDAAKRRLYREVAGLLGPGGVFVHGDAIRPDQPPLRKANDLMWASYIKGRFVTLKREDRSIASILRWIDATRDAEGDRPSSLERQLRWLREAGFVRVDCFWKNFGFAVWGGLKR
ncbi:MAG: class I SAM-dependent methyltransferase [Elusimicrobia bacterium]|nr:class I SAM-dependent methyltransferase [Elusimicrobiota bacterium]